MIGHYDLVLNLEVRQRCLNIDVSRVTMYGNTGGEVGWGRRGHLVSSLLSSFQDRTSLWDKAPTTVSVHLRRKKAWHPSSPPYRAALTQRHGVQEAHECPSSLFFLKPEALFL